MKMSFYSHANKTHFHNKGFALRLVLKVRFFGTRKWPIETGGSTYDKRVKVLLVGQDRVGKTSLGKALRGEPFNEAELSTEGV